MNKACAHLNVQARALSIADNSNNEIPHHLLTSNASQDIFLVVDSNTSAVTMVPSKHSGHQFFKCLAELNRGKFLNEVKRDPTSRYTATMIVESICNNCRGNIYIKRLDSADGTWRSVIQSRLAIELVFQTLLSMYANQVAKNTTPEQEEELPPPPIVSPEPTRTTFKEQNNSPDSTMMEAVEGLLLVRTTSWEKEKSVEQGNLPPKKRVRFSDEEPQTIEYCDDQCQSAKKKLKLLQHEQQRQQRSSTRFESAGITIADITDQDVLCGESGQGLLETRNPGNVRFCALVDANAVEFHSGTDKRKKLQLATQAVSLVHQEGGRFLVVNPNTGLLHEVRLEKAWSKTLRTFQAYEQVAKQRSARHFLMESHQKRSRAKSVGAANTFNATSA